MKKFYILTLALGVAATALAGSPAKSTSFEKAVKTQRTHSKMMQSVRRAQAPQKEVGFKTLADVAGDYEWTAYSFLTMAGVPGVCEMTVTNEATGEVSISFPIDSDVVITNPLKGFVDLEKGTFTIDNLQKIGYDSDGDLYFYLKDIADTGYPTDGAIDDAYVEGTIDGQTITFPPYSVWAIGDPNNEGIGYWYVTYNNVFIHDEVSTEDPNKGWTSLGNATFMDGWVLPAFGIDQTDPNYWYEVELQQNDEVPTLYRLVDPYHGNFPLADYNETNRVGYIQFDVDDPEHVLFDVIDCGFAYAALDISRMYCYNLLTWATLYFEAPADLIIQEYGDMFPYTTFKDGVVNLSSEEDACFGDQSDKTAGYMWNDQYGEPANMQARITFPVQNGIQSVDADNNAPAEYYNLQGLRVANPEKGQVVISRQGNKTAKFVVK